MIDLITPWLKLQEDMLALQRKQIEAATKVAGVGEDMLAAQKASLRAWERWASLWGVRR